MRSSAMLLLLVLTICLMTNTAEGWLWRRATYYYNGRKRSANTTEGGIVGALSDVCPDVDLSPGANVSQLVVDAFHRADVNKDGELNAGEVDSFATMIDVLEYCTELKQGQQA